MASLKEILEAKIGKDAEAQAAKQAIEVRVSTSQAEWMRERADLFAASVRANAELRRVEATDSSFDEVMYARSTAKQLTDDLAAFDALYKERFPAA